MTGRNRPTANTASDAVIRVERFEYTPADLLLRLSLRLSLEPPSPSCAMLFVEREAVEHSYLPLLACTGRAPMDDAEEWLWRGAFAVPPDLVSDPGALFAVRLRDDVLLALPLPSEHLAHFQESSQREGVERTWPYAIRRGALLFVVTCQLSMVPAWSSAQALVDGAPLLGSSESTPETPPQPPVGGSGEPAPETPAQPPAGGAGELTPETPPQDGGTGQSSTTPASTPAPSSTSTAPQGATQTPATTPAPATSRGPRVVLQRRQKNSAAGKESPNVNATRPHPATGGAKASDGGATFGKNKLALPKNNVALPPQIVGAQAGPFAAELAGSAARLRALDFYRIPLFLLPIYRAAAVRYEVPWQILAAINEIETDYGNDLSVSTAGAVGWMQFMPATWLQYGVDALNTGYADPNNPVDAIFAAARYLRAAGAAHNLPAAILAYNHSAEYVSSVLLRAKLIATYPKPVISTLTGLVDARLPVTGKQLAWDAPAPAASSSIATARATRLPGSAAANAAAPARPGSSPPPSPTAVAAAATGSTSASAQAPRLVDLRSARNASVVAVGDGQIIQLGSSLRLGKYVVLRDIDGDVFTYAGLASIAPSYMPKAATPGADRRDRRSGRAGRALALRVGSVVAKGTVLARVRVPFGAKDGHLHFAIRPAGDPNTIDPDPILASWRQLSAALNQRGAKGQSNLLGTTATPKASVTKSTHPAGTRHRAPLPPAMSGELTAAQWERLMARVAVLPTPKVSIKPSSAAIPDPPASASNRASGSGPLSLGG